MARCWALILNCVTAPQIVTTAAIVTMIARNTTAVTRRARMGLRVATTGSAWGIPYLRLVAAVFPTDTLLMLPFLHNARHLVVITAVLMAGLAAPITASSAHGLGLAATSADQDYAMDFAAGSLQYATAATEVIPTLGAFTVSVWVYDDSLNDSDWRHILSQGNGGTAFYLGTTSNSQELRAGDTWLSTGVDLPVGQWAHLALVADGSGAATLYLNGQAAATTSSGFSPPSTTGANLQVGRQFTGFEYWNGRVDQVKIYGAALNAAAVAVDMHTYGMYTGGSISASDHIALYDFNEGPAGSTGTGTVANRVVNAAANTNLTTANAPVYSDIAASVSNGDEYVVTFPRSYLTASGGWTPPARVTAVRALLVGGGGGGGGDNGGGGGGGGVYDSATVSADVSAGVQPITVGQGSLGARYASPSFVYGSINGQSTTAFGLTAGGGGLAGTAASGRASGEAGATGTAGGSGGGGASDPTNYGAGGAGGPGTPPGEDGGNGAQAARGSAGGGGAGAPGADATTVAGAAGGAGISSDITGMPVFYGGGGGGGNDDSVTPGRSAGGLGGGGRGASGSDGFGEAGDANTGGGGGGGTWTGTTARGGNGGSGVVIIRYSPTPIPPAPAVPPSAPTGVLGQPANNSATVAWTAPSSPGSFPITNYQVQLSPGGITCLVPAPRLDCDVTGLRNGMTYTASVRALNGAGWGPFSAASEPFTPAAPVVESIMITGERGEVRGRPGVVVQGVATGLVGQVVTSRLRFPGQSSYSDGSSRIVSESGTFTWQRRTSKKMYVYFVSGSVRSNRVIISVN